MQSTHFKFTLYYTNIGNIPQICEQLKNNHIVKKSISHVASLVAKTCVQYESTPPKTVRGYML